MAHPIIRQPRTVKEALKCGYHFDGGDLDFHEERPLDGNHILLTGSVQLTKYREDEIALEKATLEGAPLERHSLGRKPPDAGFTVRYRGVLTLGPVFKSGHQRDWEQDQRREQRKDADFLRGFRVQV